MGTPIEGGEVQGGSPEGGGETPGQNPAWNDVLSALPPEYHEVVTPHFQQWDQSAQSRIEQANAKVSAYEPYQQFVDNGITPDQLEQGLQLAYQVNANPEAVYRALAETYGYGGPPNAQSQEGEGEEAEVFQDPRFDQLQQGLDLVAQTVLQEQQRKLENEAEAQISSEIASLNEKHPGISEEFIVSLMVNGFDADAIGEKWNSISQNILQTNPRPFAPNVMGSSSGGTGLPSQAINPRTLDEKATRELVARMAQLGTQD